MIRLRRPGMRPAAALIASLALLLASNTEAMADPTIAPQPAAESALAVYQDAYPTVPADVLAARLAVLPARKQLLERFGTEWSGTFAGSWYDYATGVWHLSATDADAAAEMAALARDLGVAVETRVVTYSYQELARIAAAISAGEDPVLGQAAFGRAGVDPDRNRVVVALRRADAARLTAALPELDPAVSVQIDDSAPMSPAACNSRQNCGVPMRGGISLWRAGTFDPICSLGFTARATDGSRWALTAGHCVAGLNQRWGHGEQSIGVVRQFRNAGAVDVARIHIQNSYWLQAAGGWMYSTPSTAVAVNYAIQSRPTIEIGDVVCANGQHSDGRDNCGVVSSVSEPAAGGMPTVSAIDVCRGDSGGSAYLLFVGQGVRWAYGIVSSGEFASPIDQCTGGNRMAFSPLPDINAFFDAGSAATVRVETR